MDACPICNGTGVDLDAPRRQTRKDAPSRNTLMLVRPCFACEGRGVIAPSVDRDYARPSVSERLQECGAVLSEVNRRVLARA